MSDDDSVDTVVVGAGSAGSVIASRATEGDAVEVMLVEAGPDYPPPTVLPADLRDGRQNSYRAHDWGYRHLPTAGQVPFPFPRGRVVGGSSAVNTCIALRGQPYDYDEWAALGLPEWSYEACSPYFARVERDLDFPGRGEGVLPIRRHPPSEWTPWQRHFESACRSLGYPPCADHNAPGSAGVGPHPMNKLDGARISAARAYLSPEVRGRRSLRVRADTRVARVEIREGRVQGVEIVRHGRRKHVRARRVILAAGAINSLAILLRSGVGPDRDVRRIGAEPVAVVPAIGRRLLDHHGAAMILVPKRPPAVDDPLIQVLLRYTSRGSTHPADMQLQAISKLHLPEGTLPFVAMSSAIGKPRGVGRIRFAGAGLDVRPIIESMALEDESDLERAVESMELAALVATEIPIADRPSFAFPSERTLLHRERIRSWIRKSCGSGYHPCGTVPMGPEDSDDAAVDGRGRVRGVAGLIVADASIMPTIPSANTNLPTMMIGERFGEWLHRREL